MGCEVVETHHVVDDPEATDAVIAQSLDGRCDLVVTIGGISAGKRDFFPAAFANSGVKLVVKGANIQPGKPVIVGKHENAVVLGLPGNPVSALACSCVFGWPIVRKLQGVPPELPWQKAPLATNVQPNPNRLCFRPCQLVDGKIAIPTWQGSGDLIHTASTHGLVQLPSADTELQEGDVVSSLAFPWV
jgi:molybdopterin molybdotransferase